MFEPGETAVAAPGTTPRQRRPGPAEREPAGGRRATARPASSDPLSIASGATLREIVNRSSRW